MTTLDKLTPEYIQKLVPYQSARRLGGNGKIWLNANENPKPNSFTLQTKNLNRYPDEQPMLLRKLYAEYTSLQEEQLLITRGADEGIELIIRAFCQPSQDNIMYFPPTYGMYQISANSLNVGTKAIPLLDGWQLPIEQIKEQINNTKVIYICNPNNPTGNLFTLDEVKQVLEIAKDKAIVVLDQAYIEFSPEQAMLNLLTEYSNLVILRTLSKAFGLAGLRCGFILSNQEIISIIGKIIAPYPIPTVVSEIAEQYLTLEQIKVMQSNVAKLNQAKTDLIAKFQQFSFVEKVYQSASNFILIKVTAESKVFEFLKQAQIIVRDQSAQYGLQNCIRITVGTDEENKELINTLSKITD